MPDNDRNRPWGARKMDEFIAWISQPAAPGNVPSQPVDPTTARRHIDNILEYIGVVDDLAKTKDRDAMDLMMTLSPLRTLSKAARTGTEVAAAAKASDNYFRTFMNVLEKRAGEKAVVAGGFDVDDR